MAEQDLPSYAWPGGYPLYYVDGENGDVLCPECANKAQDVPLYSDVNWEDGELYCADCGNRIPSAYAETEDGENG